MSDGDQAERNIHVEYAITTTSAGASTSTSASTANRGNRANGDEFGRAISKVAVAQICESVGFEGFHESALESLTDVAVQYLRDLGKTAKFYSNLAGRTESNVFDIIRGLEDLAFGLGFSGAFEVNQCVMKSGVVEEIVEYVGLAEEIPFAQPVPRFPVVKEVTGIPSFVQMDETPEIKSVPSWLPAFPDPHTYKSTPVWNERVSDPRADKIELARQRRKAERSLLSLQQRLVSSCPIDASLSAEPVASTKNCEVNGRENPFLSRPLQPGEGDVSPVPPPAKLSGGDDQFENGPSLLETFAPAIEAMKDVVSESGNSVEKSLPEKRPAVCLEFKAGKKVLGEPLDLRLRNKGPARTAAWFGRDDEKDDKKRRAEYILRQSMENQHDIAQL